jgi:ABC-type sugar transport system permease subunit
MSEEIIIKTETIKISDLQGREKQIYDYAYKKVFNDAIDANLAVKYSFAKALMFVVIIVIIALVAFKLTPPLPL